MKHRLNTNRKEQLQVLANALTRANTHFYFGEKLHENYRRPGAPSDFWDYTLTAHVSIALLYLCLVYDSHKDGLNLFNFLKSIDEKTLNQAQRKQLNVYIAECRPKSQNPLVESLRKWRNNIIAHYNLETALDRDCFDKNNPDEPEKMIRILVPSGFEILEWCSHLYGAATTYQRLAPGKDSCEEPLEWLRTCVKQVRA
jgi:septum formation topological specificity factor MinE